MNFSLFKELNLMAVWTGIEPAISYVTGRRDNRYATRPFIKAVRVLTY